MYDVGVPTVKSQKRMLAIYASVCLAASIPLFIFRPIAPIGLISAIAFGVVGIELLLLAFFPTQARYIGRRFEQEVEKQPRPTHLGRWVP